MENSVVILAGGLGTRLGKLTENLPKSMIGINQKPFYVNEFVRKVLKIFIFVWVIIQIF